jgi:hypothetical protein
MNKEDAVFEGLERRLDRTSLVIALLAAPIVLLLVSSKAALSVVAGGVLSYINFHWLRQAVDFVILQGAQGNIGRRVMFRFVARYALIGLVLYVTIRSSVLDLLYVFAGLLIYIVAILVECVAEVCRVLIGDYRNGRT